jgi:hypothetical protein
MLCLSFPFCVGFVLIAISASLDNLVVLYAGRVIAGKLTSQSSFYYINVNVAKLKQGISYVERERVRIKRERLK